MSTLQCGLPALLLVAAVLSVGCIGDFPSPDAPLRAIPKLVIVDDPDQGLTKFFVSGVDDTLYLNISLRIWTLPWQQGAQPSVAVSQNRTYFLEAQTNLTGFVLNVSAQEQDLAYTWQGTILIDPTPQARTYMTVTTIDSRGTSERREFTRGDLPARLLLDREVEDAR